MGKKEEDGGKGGKEMTLEEIVGMVREGKSAEEIARELGVREEWVVQLIHTDAVEMLVARGPE